MRTYIRATAIIFLSLTGTHGVRGEVAISEVIWYNPPSDVPNVVEEAIARFASPDIIVVEAGTRLAETRMGHCVNAGDGYTAALNEFTQDLNFAYLGTQVDLYSAFEQSTIALVPNCLGSQFEEIHIGGGRWAWDVFADARRRNDPNAEGGWETFRDRALEASNLTNLDEIPEGSVISLPPGIASFSASTENAQLLAKTIANSFGIDSVAIREISPVGSSENLPESFNNNCQPNNLTDINKRSVSHFTKMYESIIASRRYTTSSNSVKVAIFDTGLRRLRHPLVSAYAQPVSTKIDPKRLRVFLPPATDREKMPCFSGPPPDHAEDVLGVVTGGYYSSFHNSHGGKIDVVMHNIYQDLPQMQPDLCIVSKPDARLLERIIATMIDSGRGADIVNISQTWPKDDETNSLRRLLDSGNKSSLLVVAAGNDARSYDERPRYPGAFDHGDDSHMIVVAGVQNGKIMHPQSSYHSDLVDIGAPSCNVQTLHFEPNSQTVDRLGFREATSQIGFESGTSFAAPLVSHVAAQILILSGDNEVNTIDLKWRILASSDIEGKLFNKISHGRILNPAKALSIYEDYLELNDGRVFRGKVVWPNSNSERVNVCPGLKIKEKGLLKVSKVEGGPEDGQFLVYYKKGGRVKTHFCNSFSDLWLSTDGPENSASLPLKFEGHLIRDVVFSMRLDS